MTSFTDKFTFSCVGFPWQILFCVTSRPSFVCQNHRISLSCKLDKFPCDRTSLSPLRQSLATVITSILYNNFVAVSIAETNDYFYGHTSLWNRRNKRAMVSTTRLRHSLLLFRGKVFEWGSKRYPWPELARLPWSCNIKWQFVKKGRSQCSLNEIEIWNLRYVIKYGRYRLFSNNCHHYVNRMAYKLRTDCRSRYIQYVEKGTASGNHLWEPSEVESFWKSFSCIQLNWNFCCSENVFRNKFSKRRNSLPEYPTNMKFLGCERFQQDKMSMRRKTRIGEYQQQTTFQMNKFV